MKEVDKAELQSWLDASQRVEEWNDTQMKALFRRARNLVPLLVKELKIAEERLKMRKP